MINLLELKNKVDKLIQDADSLDVEVLVEDTIGWYGIKDICINKCGDISITIE